MIFSWWKRRRRRKILEQPFPEKWQDIVHRRVVHYDRLTEEEKGRFLDLVQIFLAEKKFEGCNGQEITDEIRLVVAAHACLLILNLPHDYYAKVRTILIYPSTVTLPPLRQGIFTRGPLIARTELPIVGQAFMHGTVMLVWDAVKRDTTHPQGGHNVVFHEFAHILDMFDGRADGTPLLPTREEYRRWAEVCTRIYHDVQEKIARGKKTFLSRYSVTNEAEFFAVATEYFFNRPRRMQQKRPALYTMLMEFYRQDPRGRDNTPES